MLLICFFKQKTAYEVRMSDWSSDVCSSDLVEKFIQLVFRDEIDGGGPALIDFFLLMQERGGWQYDAADIAYGMLHGLIQADRGALVVFGVEASVHVATATAQLQNNGCVAGFGWQNAVFDRTDHGFAVRAGAQPERRDERKE